MAAVTRNLITPFTGGFIDELDKRGILTERDVLCRSCGKGFSNNDLVDSRYKNGRNYANMVKRHLVCAIFHNVITEAEAQKKLKNVACLVPALVEHQETKLAEERRRLFSERMHLAILTIGGLVLALVHPLVS